jgi:hypothetical protein
MDETVPLYFNDEEGNALENGEIVRSNPVALNPSGTPELLTVNWTSGGGNFHIRSLHIETDDGIGTYRMTGSLGDAISTIDVQGGNHQADVLLFTGSNSLPDRCGLYPHVLHRFTDFQSGFCRPSC